MLRILRNLGDSTEFSNKEQIMKKIKILESMIKLEKSPEILRKLKNLETFLNKYVLGNSQTQVQTEEELLL